MDFNPDSNLTGDVESAGSGGGGGRGGLAVGGGIGGVIVLVLALVFGINITGNDNDGSSAGGGVAPSTTPTYTQCRTGADANRDPNCRWKAYVTSVNDFWAQEMKGYTPVKTVTFSNRVQTGCGAATSEVGPFYCPEDKVVYLDTAFADKLLTRLGTTSDHAAEAYILGHEYGHHVQDLLGTLSKYQSNQTGETSPSVRLELQADCYAGVWFHELATNKDAIIRGVTQSDINSISDAAQAVGDDRIEQQARGRVTPESWTHGSAKMRHHWLAVGYDSGNPKSCDTFATNDLGQ